MKCMKIGQKIINSVLFDVNVCIDILSSRSLTTEESKSLFLILRKNELKSFIPACSLDTIYYILRKMDVEDMVARKSIQKLIKYTGLVYLSDEAVQFAFSSDIQDFEDSIINSIAVYNDIDLIITSNTKDFVKSTLPVFHPKEFIALFLRCE